VLKIEIFLFKSGSNKVQVYNFKINTDEWNSGKLDVDGWPVMNTLLNLLGIKQREIKVKIVSTDYSTYVVGYRCNDDSWLKSFDEYSISVRRIADAPTALNNINLAINNIYGYNNTALAQSIAAFAKYDQTNPNCKQITDF
jgi:hypothetical protein